MNRRQWIIRIAGLLLLILLIAGLACFSDMEEVAELEQEASAEKVTVAMAPEAAATESAMWQSPDPATDNPLLLYSVDIDPGWTQAEKEVELLARVGEMDQEHEGLRRAIVPLIPDASVEADLAYDTWVYGYYPDDNYGTDANMFVGWHTVWVIFSGWANGLFKSFASGCPEGEVYEAYLWVFIENNYLSGPEIYYVRRVASSWSETGVTFNNAPAATGGQEATQCNDGHTGLDWYDATAAVQEVCNDGQTDYGLYFFTANSGNDDIELRTYEFAGLPAAYLEIYYTPLNSSSSSTTYYTTTYQSTTYFSTSYYTTTFATTSTSTLASTTTMATSTIPPTTTGLSTSTSASSSTTPTTSTIGPTTTVGSSTSTGPSTMVSTSTVCNPPVAEFTGNPLVGKAPLQVQFTDQSNPNGCPITSYYWIFGTAGTSTEQNPSFTFNDPGAYTIRLTVENDGGSDYETKENYILVTPPGDDDATPDDDTTPDDDDNDDNDDATPDDDTGDDDNDDNNDTDDDNNPIDPGDSDADDGDLRPSGDDDDSSNCGCGAGGEPGAGALGLMLLTLFFFVSVVRRRAV